MSSEFISKQEIEQAQQAWGEGVVAIGAAKDDRDVCVGLAQDHVEQMYAYELGTVLFKPTKAAEAQFRNTPKSALSYFVGGNSDFPEDHGFALQPWSAVRFENSGIIEGSQALAMGNYYFTGSDGSETKVEYTFGYIKDSEGRVRINLHHSSLPYKPEH